VIFREDVGIALQRTTEWVPFMQLLQAFRGARFESDPCRAAIDALCAQGLARELFSPTAFEDDGPIVTDRVIDARAGELALHFLVRSATGAAQPLSIPLADPDDVASAVEMLRLGFRSRSVAQFRAEYGDLGDRFLDHITAREPRPRRRWAHPRRPGIYRREHATLLIRSETTSVLLDPLVRHTAMPNLWSMPDASDPLDAILISHSHTDHWNPVAILERVLDPGTPVIVPDVPRRSVLTEPDMALELRALGLRAAAPRWGETLLIGDIMIDVLPFYGEQPTRDDVFGSPDLRSYGNCYRITTPQMSALVLVDAGSDPAGNMVEVAARSRRMRGPVDVVLACLREFASPFFGGLWMYWSVLPLGLLRDLFARFEAGRLPSTTAGPSGIAEICAAAGARYFLPYAHGYQGEMAPITDVGWGEGEPAEAVLLAALARELAARGAGTRVARWDVGDIACVAAGDLAKHRQELV
jgi:L-ascorbate metabolism protein UlaG (beta-lactamase superfamily)